MLDLESSYWRELSHAYGPALDTPEILRRIYSAPTDDDWSDLYGTVAHQGSISTAAYAAVPHVVAAARAAARHDQLPHVSFVAFVLLGYDHKPVPDPLRVDYEFALADARSLALGLLSEPLGFADSVYLLQALSALSGRIALARVIEGLADGEVQTDCPGCSRHLYVHREKDTMTTYAFDPVRGPKGRGTPIQPGDLGSASSYKTSDEDADLLWLADVAKPLNDVVPVDLLRLLDGECSCPACGRPFHLYSELRREAAEQAVASGGAVPRT